MRENLEISQFLVVDDDETFTLLLKRSIEDRGFFCTTATSEQKAFEEIKKKSFDFAIIDLKINNENGLTIISHLNEVQPNCRILMLTGYASIATAVDAIKRGAYQYLGKPASLEDIFSALKITDTKSEIENSFVIASVNKVEWEHIQKVLNQENGNISSTARILGMHRRTLQRKLNKRPVKK